jgi:SAM-dependent methyltransferase
MPAEALTLADDAFDVVLCQFGLMFVPDPIAALTKMHRVLRPHGRLGVAVWSTPDKVGHFVARRALLAALPPVHEPPTPSPTSLGEPGLIESLVARAGFADIATERYTRTHDIENPEEEWARLSEEWPFAVRLQDLEEDRGRVIKQEVIEALEHYRVGPNIRMQSEAIIVTASRRSPT